MKNLKPIAMIAILATGLALSSCGKTKRYEPTTSSGGTVVNPAPPPVVIPPVIPPVDPPPAGGAPLSYEFTRNGTQTYTTGSITTDNVLKIKFKVTAEQGNQVWKASELKVTIAVNGVEVTPTYTSNQYIYGKVGETSNVVDLSAYITPGVASVITVKLPKNDFYCTYVPNPFYTFDYTTYTYVPVNPQYGQYPGCRKEVYKTHNWSGILTVQTSATQAI